MFKHMAVLKKSIAINNSFISYVQKNH